MLNMLIRVLSVVITWKCVSCQTTWQSCDFTGRCPKCGTTGYEVRRD